MEEPVVGGIIAYLLGGYHWQDALKSLAGDVEEHCHNLVAQFNGVEHQAVVVVRTHAAQSVGQGELGVEQSYVGIVGCPPEVRGEHAVVEQHLHVVLHRCYGLARLLFHQQAEVARHEVHSSLDSQCRTDERGFEQRLLTGVVAE